MSSNNLSVMLSNDSDFRGADYVALNEMGR
jgi:hypothetical protein